MRAYLLAILFVCAASAAPPYRFLLVIGDQWEDDSSYLIERPGDVQVLAALLKTWGLPFDVLRLDQQRLDAYHLLDRDGRPRYGTIVWDAGPESLKGKDLALLNTLSAMGVSLVALGDTVAAPEVAALAGVRYVSEYKSQEALSFQGAHFVTRGLESRGGELIAGGGYSLAGTNAATSGATVLARRAAVPYLAVNTLPGGSRVVWLGAERSVSQLQNQLVRDLLKRSLVWAQGYAAYPEYQRAIILFMDDIGTPDKTFLPYWHYRTPSEEEIRTGLIEPLKRHNAVLDVNVNTGYVDRKTRRVVNPWRQRVTDAIDGKTVHDFASTKRGIDAGIAAGVFYVQSHGWTHMLPDLDSPPGPFWDAAMDGVGSLDWYNEFGDGLRKREVPAIVQREHMRRSIECIREDFGVTPHVVRPGGGLYSKTSANNTSRNAAVMGFALATWNWAVYLGPDLAISLESVSRRGSWEYTKRVTAADIPWTIDAPYWLGFHDRDIALENGSVARLLKELGPGVRYMSGSEYAGYLHARVRRSPGEALELAVDYEGAACSYFASRPSRWTVHLSDETRASLQRPVPEKQVIELDKGLGTRVLWRGSK
jgi:peptidoglycan/xylan/chitin deacetylase (PgdA/CDA1 family)